MTIQRLALRIAMVHFIISLFSLYILVAFEMPGRAMPLGGTIFAGIWAVLNPPVFLARKGMEWYSGLPLAFYAVLALQVCMSVGIYLSILWLSDKRSKSKA
ncbi:MAG: hypothetical protein JNN25_03010 [Candidatus Kapabacteria bacterium]|nr:hypothetical protein [Candidatus Kapabacteria bacterium]